MTTMGGGVPLVVLVIGGPLDNFFDFLRLPPIVKTEFEL